MEINFPNLVNAALPDRHKHGRNAVIISNNMGPNHNEQGFLSQSFPRSPPRLYVAAETGAEATMDPWREEGFDVRYLGLGEGEEGDAQFCARLAMLGKDNDKDEQLGPCETYGIVAYGDAAAICLEYFHVMDNNPDHKLAVLVAYYPTEIPDTRAQFPSAVEVLVHLAEEKRNKYKEEGGKKKGIEIDVVSHSQLVGIQGKRRVTRRRLGAGLGVGKVARLAYPAYVYDAPPGFAEPDLDDVYDRVAAGLAWTRSLTALRKGFRMVHVGDDLEMAVEQHVEGKFYTRNLAQTMSNFITTTTTTTIPHVTYVPTLTGGIGTEELTQFYTDCFLASNPPSTKLRLLSRTAGADRVVDELYLSLMHTQEIPWLLPGVPPTGKRVEIAVVSIVALRGGKICHEHVYWDQASVLAQVGLLHPVNGVPEKFREKGVRRLPVVGRSAARRLLRGFDGEDGEADNELIPGWYDKWNDNDEDERGDVDVKGKGKGKENAKKNNDIDIGEQSSLPDKQAATSTPSQQQQQQPAKGEKSKTEEPHPIATGLKVSEPKPSASGSQEEVVKEKKKEDEKKKSTTLNPNGKDSSQPSQSPSPLPSPAKSSSPPQSQTDEGEEQGVDHDNIDDNNKKESKGEEEESEKEEEEAESASNPSSPGAKPNNDGTDAEKDDE
ncbi:hypothetical protein F5Y17DRAFT_273118 [Xylariaceae sp. FL0594]|nr:hypothetical protein F5Y17DRAFT_273118 [Xylariaceae sp. FL0594]